MGVHFEEKYDLNEVINQRFGGIARDIRKAQYDKIAASATRRKRDKKKLQ